MANIFGKFAAIFVLVLVGTAFACQHTASVSPTSVEGNSNVLLTFTISHSESSVKIKEITISDDPANGKFVIDQGTIVCPANWAVSTSSAYSVTCKPSSSSYYVNKNTPVQISFHATSPNPYNPEKFSTKATWYSNNYVSSKLVSLEVTAPTAVCGNGAIETPEACDDSNTLDSDGCSAVCEIEQGYTCEGEPSVCTQPVCGNSIIETPEACDDSNTVSGDGCSDVCQLEQTAPVCGNSIIETPEACDDSNTLDSDGCSAVCEIEQGYTCEGEPSVCASTAVCGNDAIETPETCDDANTVGGDGCSATCQIEGTLVVKKFVVNDGNTGTPPTSADFSITVGGGDYTNTFPGSEVGETLSLAPGTYDISENSAFSDYAGAFTLDCVDENGTAVVEIASGGSYECDITNTYAGVGGTVYVPPTTPPPNYNGGGPTLTFGSSISGGAPLASPPPTPPAPVQPEAAPEPEAAPLVTENLPPISEELTNPAAGPNEIPLPLAAEATGSPLAASLFGFDLGSLWWLFPIALLLALLLIAFLTRKKCKACKAKNWFWAKKCSKCAARV